MGQLQTKSAAALLPVYWSGPPTRPDVSPPRDRSEQRARVPRLLSGSPWQTLPTESIGKRLRVFRLGKAEQTKSPSSRRREYVSGVADRTPAAQNITSPFLTPGTFSAGSAT